jgi:hypothetical protein
LQINPPAISGRGDVQLRATREATAIALDANGLHISEITSTAGPLRFQHTGDRLCAPPRPPPKESELQKRGVTYSGGALVLHELRGELGDPIFWDGIRRYVKDRAGKGARSEDLRVALEAASGRDLRPFFAAWVYASAPDLYALPARNWLTGRSSQPRHRSNP